MKKIITLKKEIENLNKKPLKIMGILIIIGIITGILASNYFIIDANQKIQKWNEGIKEWREKWQNFSWINHSLNNNSINYNNNSGGNYSNWNNTGNLSSTHQNNSNHTGYFQYLDQLSYNDVILPIMTVILLSISSYYLLALIVTYAKIYKSSKSKYILGLMFVLVPLLIVTTFFIRISKSLFFSSSLEYSLINTFFGFGVGGIGSMLSILSVFMIIGFGILLYLSNE